MRSRIALVLLLALAIGAAAPATAAAGPFERLKDTLASRYAARFEHVPMGGLVRLIVKAAKPDGVLDMKVAPITGYDRARLAADGTFETVVAGILGRDWRPLVRVKSSRDGAWTSLHLKTGSKQCTLLVVALDEGDGALVELTLRPEKLLEWIRDPVRRSHDTAAGAAR